MRAHIEVCKHELSFKHLNFTKFYDEEDKTVLKAQSLRLSSNLWLSNPFRNMRLGSKKICGSIQGDTAGTVPNHPVVSERVALPFVSPALRLHTA